MGWNRVDWSEHVKKLIKTVLSVGDLVLAYQTDRRCVVGMTRVVGLPKKRGKTYIELQAVQVFDPPVQILKLKQEDPEIAAVNAFKHNRMNMLYIATPSEARALLRVCKFENSLTFDAPQQITAGADTANIAPPSTLFDPTTEDDSVAEDEGGIFSLVRRGVRDPLTRFLAGIPRSSALIWVTFSFAPYSNLFKILSKYKKVRVLCSHPAHTSIRRENCEAWYQHFEEGSLRGLHHTQGLPDDVDERYGKLHAKCIVARSADGQRHWLATGSFNLAYGSIERNAETFAVIDNEAEASQAWAQVSALLEHEQVSDIGPEDCGCNQWPELEGAPSQTGVTGAVDLQWDVWNPAMYSPVALRAAKQALDEMLQEWPGENHPGHGHQWRIFRSLWERSQGKPASILFLPVGVGKTYIALRWLLEHLSPATIKAGKFTIFLVPNEWIQKSVQQALDYVIEGAKKIAIRERLAISPEKIEDELRRFVLVRRSCQIPRRLTQQTAIRKRLSAFVADECHNWNPNHQQDLTLQRALSYTEAINTLQGKNKVPVLGLSATPCRMDRNRFSITLFAKDFTGEEVKPDLHLHDAIESGLLARPDTHLLLPKHQNRIESLLKSEGQLVQWGDYSNTILRLVWDVLDQHRDQLIDEILEALIMRKRRRVVIFTPPVGEASDGFVDLLKKRVEMQIGPSRCLDFRSRSGSDAEDTFETFRRVDPLPGKPIILVTTDRFGEGVSVPDIDGLVMLRATLSPRIAVQALGPRLA